MHPSKVLTTSTGVNPSFSSQEPRRPRFSFFNLHNVKERTLLPQWQNVVGARLQISIRQNKLIIRLPGRSFALSEIANSGNNMSSFASSAPRYLSEPEFIVNTAFQNFGRTDFLSRLIVEFIVRFQRLASVPAAVWRRALQR